MLKIKRIPTDNSLVLDTEQVSIIVPPRLIDIDLYENSNKEYLSINKLINIPYELSAYKGYNNKQSVYIASNKPIKRELINKHTKDNIIVLEYQDLFISVSTSNYTHDLDNLIIPKEVQLDNTYNSKLVIFIGGNNEDI